MALRFDLTPYGFFAKHQAQLVPAGTPPTAIAEMTVDRIAGWPELAHGFGASLVAGMAGSPNFATTDAIWRRLRGRYSSEANLCSQLLEATKTNNQIFWANSPHDAGEPYQRVIIEYLRRQPGGAVIASDIDAYATYLEQEAEAETRAAAARERLEQQSAASASKPF
jgi:hypothetical protein